MYSILIADDELRLCKLIARLIRWEEHGLEPLGFVHDGISCLEKIRAQRPQIVISDIRMPGLSGLDVVSRCREEGLEAHFILLTGYSEFEYAYTAIKKGVVDFLLKPINAEELNQAIEKAVYILRDEPPETPSRTGGELSSNYILDFFHARRAGDDLAAVWALLRDGQALLPCILSIDKKTEITGSIDGAISQLLKLTDRCFRTENIRLHTATTAGGIYMLMHFDQSSTKRGVYCLQSLLDAILESASIQQVCDLTICVGTPICEPKDAPRALSDALNARKARLVIGKNRIIDAERLRFSPKPYAFSPPDASDFLRAVNALDVERSCELLNHLFLSNVPNDPLQAHHVLRYAEKFTRFITDIVVREVDALESFDADMDALLAELSECSRIEDIAHRLTSALSRGMGDLVRQISQADRQVIQTVKSYIDEHFAEDLTLTSLGARVYLNPVYLGNLFKRETGVNFSTHLILVRMGKAKELLVSSMRPIGEIAALVGYRNTRHFSKTFVRHVGIRPHEYRKYHSHL